MSFPARDKVTKLKKTKLEYFYLKVKTRQNCVDLFAALCNCVFVPALK